MHPDSARCYLEHKTLHSILHCLDESKRQAQKRLADLIMQTERSGTRDCCGMLWDYPR